MSFPELTQLESLLDQIEKNISCQDELAYFYTHKVRYKFILKKTLFFCQQKPCFKNKLLDIGCYPLHIFNAFKNLGFDVYGVSSSHEPIKGNKKIITLNIETDKFPYPDNFFDIILCTEVLEHLLRSPVIPLKEIKRILKPEGIAIITTPNVLRSVNRFSLLFGRNIYPGNKAFYDEEAGDDSFYYRHNKEYTMAEMEELITSAGLKIKSKKFFISYTPFRKRSIPDKIPLGIIKIFNYLLMQILPSWRDTLYFEVRK